ncbi:MAG: methyltransferase domain-containing protein [Pseudomonadota bacterium]
MSNADQAEFWTDVAGHKWVTHQHGMDATLAPVLDLVLAEADLQTGEHVLDIGCGAGTSTFAAADYVGDQGRVTGLDISPTLLKHARTQAADKPQARFVQADAQTHAFDHAYDVMISRFGVMFFADTTAAFANITKGLKSCARMIMAAWGPAPQNPWFMDAAAVASDVMGKPPKTDRTLPGPFAFEDAQRVVRMLEAAGLQDVKCDAKSLHLTPSGSAYDVALQSTHIGPAQSILSLFEGNEADRMRIAKTLANTFASYGTADGLRIPAVINLITARAP